MITYMRKRYKSITVLFAILLGVLLVVACGTNDGDSDSDDSDTSINLTLDMELPESITGGRMLTASGFDVQRATDSDLPCSFLGSEDDDPFRNGYEMTKFMVSAIAAWTCIADTLIDIAATVDHDGEIHRAHYRSGEFHRRDRLLRQYRLGCRRYRSRRRWPKP